MPGSRDPTHTSRPSAAARVVEPKVVKRTIDPAALEMLDVAKAEGVTTYFDRFAAQQPQWQFGCKGICCRFRMVGPRASRGRRDRLPRVPAASTTGPWPPVRPARCSLTGASAHSEHGHHSTETMHKCAEGHAPDYEIKDPAKLHRTCTRLGIACEGKDDIQLAKELAKELAEAAFADFKRLDGEGYSAWLSSFATKGRMEKFLDCNVMPTGISSSAWTTSPTPWAT